MSDQPHCEHCKKGFGLRSTRRTYQGKQFCYARNCLNEYKKEHPPISFKQIAREIWRDAVNFVTAPFKKRGAMPTVTEEDGSPAAAD